MVGIANTGVSIGIFDAQSYLDVVEVLDPGYQADLPNLLIIEPSNIYLDSLAFDEVVTLDKM